MTHVEKVEIEIMVEFTKEEKDKMRLEQARCPNSISGGATL